MLISHEVPISIFKQSKKFNDYDYCLLHLTYELEDYKNFYLNSVKEGRKVLLDNSLFELGDALTNEQLAKGVEDLHPTWYVIPDCLNNKDETIRRFSSFIKDYPNLPGLKIGVAQGSTIEELTECYIYMSQYADKIAIPFDSKAFETGKGPILEQWCLGRQKFIQMLVDEFIWNDSKPHHLLGCSLAKEFENKLYKRINIETIDTSNPVVAGIVGLRFGEHGLDNKPSIKLCELINKELNENQLDLVKFNVKMFREMCK